MSPRDVFTIEALGAEMAAGRLSSVELTRRCLAAIAEHNPRLNAFITVTADEALAAAAAADAERAAGRVRSALHGIPISLKDLIDQQGIPTTAASNLRRSAVAPHDAPVTARLRAAGAVLVGKTNLHEFAYGTTNEDSCIGPARNPHNTAHSPGGSSGGSAAAIVAGLSVASVGTDTGGSIRIPAGACGIVGLKPTYGEVPTDGVVPLSRSLDHVGPLARTVTDAWLLQEVLAGRTPAPATTLGMAPLRGLRVGVLRGYFVDVLDTDVARVFHDAVETLRREGAEVEDVVLPHASDIGPVYLHLQLAEAAAYHAATIEQHPERYTPNVRLRLEMGRYVMAEDTVRAVRGRQVIAREIDAALDGRAALLTPTLPIPAPPLGAATVPVGTGTQPVRAMMLRLTQPFNLGGHPAVSLPCGTTPAGLPVGIQLAGRRGATTGLMRVARACEHALPGAVATP